jgi:2-polyprenyl-6-hydroxyphenyl methylase / 3-demethylubiquinone-9 3-methyltransferase
MQNDLAMYDDLADEWWAPRGPFVSLTWIARARAELIPPASREGAILVDVGCGGGLLHPFIEGKGYEHIGVDQAELALEVARRHGVDRTLHADVSHLPLEDGSADVVVAGQSLEHVEDPYAVVKECCRVLRPGGLLIVDTIADTRIAHWLVINLAESLPLPGMPPKGCHDHRLFVNRDRLKAACAEAGVPVQIRGLFPSIPRFLAWFLKLVPEVPIRPSRSSNILYQAVGIKTPAAVAPSVPDAVAEGAPA